MGARPTMPNLGGPRGANNPPGMPNLPTSPVPQPQSRPKKSTAKSKKAKQAQQQREQQQQQQQQQEAANAASSSSSPMANQKAENGSAYPPNGMRPGGPASMGSMPGGPMGYAPGMAAADQVRLRAQGRYRMGNPAGGGPPARMQGQQAAGAPAGMQAQHMMQNAGMRQVSQYEKNLPISMAIM